MRRRHCVHYDKAEHHHPAVAKRRKGCEHSPRVRPINRSPRDTPLATLQTPIRTVHPPHGTNLHAPARLPRSNPNTRSYKFLQKAIQRPAPSAMCPPSLHLCRPRSPYLGREVAGFPPAGPAKSYGISTVLHSYLSASNSCVLRSTHHHTKCNGRRSSVTAIKRHGERYHLTCSTSSSSSCAASTAGVAVGAGGASLPKGFLMEAPTRDDNNDDANRHPILSIRRGYRRRHCLLHNPDPPKRIRRAEGERSQSVYGTAPLPQDDGTGKIDEKDATDAPPLRRASCLQSLAHGSVSVLGRRRDMGDAVTEVTGLAATAAGADGYAYFAVYDGHGRAATGCTVDAEVMEATRALKKGTVGSTAVVAEKWIVVANCGGSRAVLSRGGVAVCNTDGYHLYGAVCTGLPVDRNADRSLPGGTVDWGCFRPVTTRNRPITLDFDRRLPLSGGNGRFRSSVVDFMRYQLREKEEKEEPGVRRYSPNPFARRRFLLPL
ncbi:hypothetical protein B296_00042687 [Ensete ventricosum]|uniref:protein-serine/threonine phosphatase n=1 Tax=Ensete ventricosum TaxID=4639 RepID=A0A426XWC5_ENSVE|nr:hypothetical protein B296_00042687 [Ensete ventricosum]